MIAIFRPLLSCGGPKTLLSSRPRSLCQLWSKHKMVPTSQFCPVIIPYLFILFRKWKILKVLSVPNKACYDLCLRIGLRKRYHVANPKFTRSKYNSSSIVWSFNFLHFFFRMAGAVRLQTIESPDNDPTCVTYIMHGEDDTLGNSLRLELSKRILGFFAS